MTVSRRSFLALAGLSVAGCAAGCSAGTTETGSLRLATGSVGGPYEVLGDRLAAELRRVGFDVTVIRTAASVENLGMLTDGRADIGFALADSADDGVRVKRQPVAALARMYMNYVHLVVRRGSAIYTARDLAGRSVSIGAEGSGTAVTAERVLLAAGLTTPRTLKLGLDESIKGLGSGRIDAFFWSGGVPTPALSALGDIRLIALDPQVPSLRRIYGPLYEHASVPAGVYGGAKPVPTVGTPSYLVCRSSLGDDVAMTVTETLFASRDRLQAPDAPGGRLDRRYAIGTGGVPLHPGAAQYYRSVYG
ncbi:TAXI family TRAP transporter solute-binding subunit [Nonomuraea sp. NBC_01738]|uniref:TAXI family TRAP transporter solute-binding subunit n=1 Tax=Nonomuraea sp. NBC_01738 TaxID=2976003 RepID=UPI002E166085|nr:TAXI family TRAP transporter solute-binding subunit [Nonomuraea sp. NBC_01738]